MCIYIYIVKFLPIAATQCNVVIFILQQDSFSPKYSQHLNTWGVCSEFRDWDGFRISHCITAFNVELFWTVLYRYPIVLVYPREYAHSLVVFWFYHGYIVSDQFTLTQEF